MSGFAVGDAVEIVAVRDPRNAPWIGRRTVVVALVPSPNGILRYRVADHPPNRNLAPWYGFRADCLRKINPPDWSAPLTTREPANIQA